MSRGLFKNLANLVVVFRMLLVFVAIGFFSSAKAWLSVAGLFILIAVAAMDWLDGFIARRLEISSKLGGLVDTLGDRITENLFLVFFAYKGLIPVVVPLVFVARSFLSDFIRSLFHKEGVSTFGINKSKAGIIFVASRASRVVYLASKIALFFMAGSVLAIEAFMREYEIGLGAVASALKTAVFYGSLVVLLFNLVRFVFLVYDSRSALEDVFTNAS